MKANQAFLQESDDAVSPVIGVILMVAITVVLAAVVFVLVSDLGGDVESSPKASFTTSKAGNGGNITVVKIDNGPITVGNLEMSATAGSCSLKNATGGAKTSGNLQAGDRIQCTADGTVTIRETSTDTLLFQTDL